MAGVRQFDEQATLERALGIFSERGFRATSMLDLAAGTGVQRGSLYHAYGGKEEIFLRAFGEYSGRFLAGAAEALDRPDTRSALLSFFDFCVDTIVAGSPRRGCLSTRTAIEAATDSERTATAVRAFLDKLETVVHHRLAAIDDGAHLTVDPRAAARLIVTTTRGIAVMERVDHTPAELRAIAETLVTTLVGP
ncbi:helix-turn-helix domain-containing protein [Amycolatopsis bartoniae]|uniref:TetR family transcriptional regulator n=1 Tax=Amycolatopsis bartoniae TaxID=941986 RepID=A0A8H9IYE9_9PSEU|nr:TetR/AcrR family transcriptional regulator [Amycolatopsis bartoniae]TVT08837.1 TetR/AcrR family transcriptional regulator [Amycolatopsis bartoniae]GHF83802.1 TetR family transcriptional regulator [Amycolatopsis bartoniae]